MFKGKKNAHEMKLRNNVTKWLLLSKRVSNLDNEYKAGEEDGAKRNKRPRSKSLLQERKSHAYDEVADPVHLQRGSRTDTPERRMRSRQQFKRRTMRWWSSAV